jgi:MoxR-like ATPase
MVLATQNPIEQEGTYPLPEAQLDRFLLKIRIDYPSEAEEIALTRQVTQAKTGADLDVEAVATLIQPATVVGLQQWAAHVTLDERVTLMPWPLFVPVATRRVWPAARARAARSRWCVQRARGH